ncbi:MAG: alpha/beta hydrolase, partial [Ferruginibacter sp.]
MKKTGSRRKIPSIFRWILWVMLVQVILFNISAALYAYKFTHFYRDPSLQSERAEGNVFTKTWRLFSGPKFSKSVITQFPGFPVDTLTFETKNGDLIDAWYGKTDTVTKGTVLIFHGVTINKGQMLPEASEFRYMGYNVLLVDFRAHGNSTGFTTTLGYKEEEEVKLAYEYVAAQGEKNIILWGSSMGAVAITKAVTEFELKPAGVILEMPFASLKDHLKARARMYGFSGFPENPFSFFVTWWIGIERGFNGFKHRTTDYAAKLTCPVLLQWGGLDE